MILYKTMRRKVEEVLREWRESDDKKCLIVSGARQIGKTFIVEEFARSNYEYHLTVNFDQNPDACQAFSDRLDVDSIMLKLSAMYPNVNLVPKKTLIFLDEIQNCPEARTSLKFFAIDGRYDVIASGSLLGLRDSEVPSYPVGYEHRIRMEPMDFEEFLWALNIKQEVIDHVKGCIRNRSPLGDSLLSTLSEYFRWYTVIGGMPEAVKSFVNNRTIRKVSEIHADIFEDYKNDVIHHAKGSQKNNVSSCFDSISVQLSRENKKFQYSLIARNGTNGNDSKFGSNYYAYSLNWLKDAAIIRQCYNVTEPRMPLEERRMTDHFKIYMVDTGLLTSSYEPSVRVEILNGNLDVNRGALTENVVAQMISAQGRKLLYFSRDRDPESNATDRMEIDFLLIVNGRLTAVEVKSGKNRSCRSLNKVMDRYGIDGLMYETRDIFTDDKGVVHMPLFAAAFIDSMDTHHGPEFDFDSIDRLNAQF